MKRIIKLTESDLTRIVRRVLREQNETPAQQVGPEVTITGNRFGIIGKTANFYLANETTKPVLPQVKINNYEIKGDQLIIDGQDDEVGAVRLKYRCGNTDDFFNLEYVRFKGPFIQDVSDFFTKFGLFGLLRKQWWRDLLMGYVKKYIRQQDKKSVQNEVSKVLRENKNPIVYPPSEANSSGKTFMEAIKSFCSPGGRTKADFASNQGGMDKGMA
jgi:hypothetical protein